MNANHHLEKQRLLLNIQIVAEHPEWLTEEPELQELLQETDLIPKPDQIT